MIPPVKKDNGSYFISMEYHLLDIKKYEDEIDLYKEMLNNYKRKNKELEADIKKLKEHIVKLLK